MKIIAIEGPDGTGKSTLAPRLAEKLGWKLIKFPDYKSGTGQAIKAMLSGEEEFEPGYFLELQHYNKVDVIKTLDPRGCYVFDRGVLSERVYALANGIDEDEVDAYRYDTPYSDIIIPDPDVTIILRGRSFKNDNDIFTNEEFQLKVQDLYFRESKRISGNIIRVSNEEKSADEVFEFVHGKVKEVLP